MDELDPVAERLWDFTDSLIALSGLAPVDPQLREYLYYAVTEYLGNEVGRRIVAEIPEAERDLERMEMLMKRDDNGTAFTEFLEPYVPDVSTVVEATRSE